MEAYKQQMFQFLTKPENFQSLLDAVRSFEDVKKQLLTDFWKHTERALVLKTAGGPWSVELSPNVHAPHAQLKIYKSSWRPDGNQMCCLTYDNLAGHLFYGLWLKWDANNSKIVALREGLKQMKVE